VTVAAKLVERFRGDCESLTGGTPGRLGVAVSGGPDSLALLLLARAAFPGAVAAATVDHRLRPEGADEARFVAGACAALGIPHATLAVDVDPARSSVQRAAREARYRALGKWAAAEALPWVATAHHADDQAETLLMRLLRGSGVTGLASVRASLPLPASAARLIRPLLGWRRETLGGIVEAAGLESVADPSNADLAYDRVRIRRRLAESAWLDPVPIARSAAALAEAAEALEWATERVWGERVEQQGECLRFDPAGLPPEIVRRILIRLLATGGSAPRGEEVARLAGRLADGMTATLAGYRCRGGAVWRFEPAPPRRQPAAEKTT
jgi:tRNA(Ile)-lysidine synthase